MNKTMLLVDPDQLKKIVSDVFDEKIFNLIPLSGSQKTDPPPQKSELIRIDQVCKMCEYKKNYIYELVRKKKIPVHRIGRSLRFDTLEIQLWLKANRPSILELGMQQLEKINH